MITNENSELSTAENRALQEEEAREILSIEGLRNELEKPNEKTWDETVEALNYKNRKEMYRKIMKKLHPDNFNLLNDSKASEDQKKLYRELQVLCQLATTAYQTLTE